MSRLSRAAAGALLAVAVSSCSNPTSTTPTTVPATITDTFSGTLAQGSTAAWNFTVGGSGTITITLVSLAPQSTITMGVGVGSPGTSGCSITSSQENVRVGAPIQGTLSAGAYCVALYDLGNMTAANTYTLTVLHP
jgi:hypothetical protein